MDGKMHGQGTLYSADGGRWKGEFRDDEKTDQGEYFPPENDSIENSITFDFLNDHGNNFGLNKDVLPLGQSPTNMFWPSGRELVLLDFETTGLKPGFGDRVVEYAYMVIGEDGIVKERHDCLINPERKMSSGATQTNGITDRMLQGKPIFAAAGKDLWRALDGRIMVAHNAAGFDLPCLVTECRIAGWNLPNMEVIDSLKLTRSVWSARDHQLTTLANMVGHRGGDAHRAMNDVDAMHSILKSLFSEFSGRFPTTQSILSVAGVAMPSARSESNYSNKALVLLRAIENKKSVIISYNSDSSGLSTRKITPEVVFIHSNGAEYFDGYCHNRMGKRTFKVDRVVNFQFDGFNYAPESFD